MTPLKQIDKLPAANEKCQKPERLQHDKQIDKLKTIQQLKLLPLIEALLKKNVEKKHKRKKLNEIKHHKLHTGFKSGCHKKKVKKGKRERPSNKHVFKNFRINAA